MEQEYTPISAPEDAYQLELVPIRDHPELGVAQQLVIDGFWKAIEEVRESRR